MKVQHNPDKTVTRLFCYVPHKARLHTCKFQLHISEMWHRGSFHASSNVYYILPISRTVPKAVLQLVITLFTPVRTKNTLHKVCCRQEVFDISTQQMYNTTI